MDYIYLVRTISLQEKTDEDLKTEFEIFKLRYPIWINKSYDEFIKFQTSWKNNKYSISYDDNCYCETYEIAYEKVINNDCDMNDCGVYDYIAIIKVPLNVCYTISCVSDSDIFIFKFDYDGYKYIKVAENNDFINFLKNKAIGIIRG